MECVKIQQIDHMLLIESTLTLTGYINHQSTRLSCVMTDELMESPEESFKMKFKLQLMKPCVSKVKDEIR